MMCWISFALTLAFGVIALAFNSKRGGHRIAMVATGLAIVSFSVAADLPHAVRIIIPFVFSPLFIGGVATAGFIATVAWLHGHAEGRSEEHSRPTPKAEFFKADKRD